jgi:deoxyribose-phosphate aldolase
MQELLAKIDHAVLQPTQGDDDVREACGFCSELSVATVCVKPSHVGLAASLLAGSAVGVSTVVGFPHGGTSTHAKVAETTTACRDGAAEIDMVVNLGKVFSEDWTYVEADIAAVVEAAGKSGALVKVIFETGLLPHEEWKVRLCQISERAGGAMVKTSTGFGYRKDGDGRLVATGATEHDVRLMVRSVSPHIGVKASGGIRTYDDAVRMIALGAVRLGTSATQAIATGARSTSSY